MKILIVEDEKRLCDNIGRYLRTEGYATDTVYDGNDAWDYICASEYDSIVLDVMLPGIDGFSLLKKIRAGEKKDVPVIMLTAKGTVEDKVKGLDLGADDYLTKPFSLEELSARLRVMIRRNGREQVDSNLYAGDLVLDTSRKIAVRGGKEIRLTAKEYGILEYLLHNRGKVMSREQIENHIWSYDYAGASNIVDVYVRNLRKKVDADYDDKLIRTVRGLGYVIE